MPNNFVKEKMLISKEIKSFIPSLAFDNACHGELTLSLLLTYFRSSIRHMEKWYKNATLALQLGKKIIKIYKKLKKIYDLNL